MAYKPRDVTMLFGNTLLGYYTLFDGLPTICTPTKTFQRVDLTLNSMNTLCLQCGKDFKDSDKRRRLFSGKRKTDVCENIEINI